MTRTFLRAACLAAAGATLSAAGQTVDPVITTTATAVTMRIPNETAPAGGVVQMKVLTTEVTPISGGRPGFSVDANVFGDVAGFGIMAPNGEIAGAAVITGRSVRIVYDGTSTLSANYPLLTVVLPIRADAIAGARTTFTLDPSSTWSFSSIGPVTATVNPGVVTVGGTTSVTDVIPGEGVWPAGTIVTVRGTGFDAKTSLKVNDAGVKTYQVVSPTEMRFTLTRTTNIRGLRITVSGEKNAVTYWAYMRGIASIVSARTLLATSEPIFSVAQRTMATLGPTPALSGAQYEAIALQNPNLTAVTIGLSLRAADGTVLHNSSRTLASRHRLALEVSELLDGIAPPAGSTIVVTASQAIDAFSLLCDEATWTLTPSLPLESRP